MIDRVVNTPMGHSVIMFAFREERLVHQSANICGQKGGGHVNVNIHIYIYIIF